MNIGERIKAKRKEKGISQKQLAETAGLSITAIQSYEYGKYKPKIEQVEAIAGALGITPYDLMGAAYWDENNLSMYSIDELLAEIKRRCSNS